MRVQPDRRFFKRCHDDARVEVFHCRVEWGEANNLEPITEAEARAIRNERVIEAPPVTVPRAVDLPAILLKPSPPTASVDVGAQMGAIERAAGEAIAEVQAAARLAIEGIEQTAAQTAPATPEMPKPLPESGWVRDLLSAADTDDWGAAEIRYQIAMQALNGSLPAQQMMQAPAERRGLTVEALARQILKERREQEQRVMSEY